MDKNIDIEKIKKIFRITIDDRFKEIKPLEEDIVIDYKPNLKNPITISTPLIPVSFYSEKELKWMQDQNFDLLNKIKTELSNRFGIDFDKDHIPIPKNVIYPGLKRLYELSGKRFEYRCMLNGQRIYYPTFHDSLENFKKVYELFSESTFTTSFLEAFENKFIQKSEIIEGKKLLSIFANDNNLIPRKKDLWNKGFDPFNHQRIMLEYSTKLPFFANLSEMGTGKTYPTIISILERLNKNEIDKAFVVCPKSISRSVWKTQIEQYSNLKVSVIDGTPQNRIEALGTRADVYVIGYEMFNVLREDIFPLIDLRTMIILDESSKIKNPKAKRSKALHEVGRLIKYKIILNGTPITQGAQDIFSQFLFLDSGETFGNSYDNFMYKYFYKPPNTWKFVLKNEKALKDISNKIYNLGLRYLKAECLDLPPKLFESREVAMSFDQWQAYINMRDQMVAWIKSKEDNNERIDASVIVVKLLRLSQITSGFSKNEFGDEFGFKNNPKLKELSNILEDELYNGNQIVIWSRFIHDLKSIEKLCFKKEISCGLLYGAVNDRKREQIVKDFLAKKIKVFIGQQGAGGLGIDLYTANKVVYYSNDYTLLNRLQSEDRTHRKGSEQHNKVTYIDLIASGPNGEQTIDHHILKIVLKEKKNVADAITRDNIREILELNGATIGLKKL